MSGLRVLLAGGGTAGHVHPALAIGAGLRRAVPGCELLYLGTERGLEAQIVPREGIPFGRVRAAGVVGGSPWRKLTALGRAGLGACDARRHLVAFRPQLVVVTGGYVCAPVGLAAYLHHVPLALQEQNAVPGLTNRFLSRFARVVFLPFPQALEHFPAAARADRGPAGPRFQVTGNPLRPALLEVDRATARARLQVPPDAEVVYAFGGSGGAERLNRAFCDALPALLRRPRAVVLYATGARYHDGALARLRELGVASQIERGRLVIAPFFERGELPLAAADLALARAGAMTVSELAARGLPAVLVPSPNVPNDEQRANARVLTSAGAARVLSDAELSGERVARELGELLDRPGELRAMAAAARSVARADALDRIVEALLRIAGGV